MPTYLTITYDTVNVSVLFNDLEPVVGRVKAYFSRGTLLTIQHFKDVDVEYIEVDISQSKASWQLNLTGGANLIPVTSINGVVPTDMNHLMSLIELIKTQGIPL